MIHPKTILKHISDDIGYGVFASEFIPAGTITYARDDLEIVIDSQHRLLKHAVYGPLVDKYAYIEASGKYVIGWDLSKYVNHSCNANTMSTGYGFEIAIRDIRAGEELSVDYGFLNINSPLYCACQHVNCRKTITRADIEHYADAWDRQVRVALDSLLKVPQPLIELLDTETYHALMRYLETGRNYRSVQVLQYHAPADCAESSSSPETVSPAINFDFPLENPA